LQAFLTIAQRDRTLSEPDPETPLRLALESRRPFAIAARIPTLERTAGVGRRRRLVACKHGEEANSRARPPPTS